jgi:diguanylate cyclase (GGDEF)-like protein
MAAVDQDRPAGAARSYAPAMSARWRAGVGVLGALGVFGVLAGDLELRPNPVLSNAYLLPVGLAAWSAGRATGIVVAVLATAALLVAEGAPQNVVQDLLLPFVANIALAWVFGTLHGSFARERQLARTDPVTGALNRRGFDERAHQALYEHARQRQPITVVCLDVDDFKRVNDRYGHDGGDAVLRAIAQTLGACVRATDVVARYGGDEFMVLFSNADHAVAGRLLARLQGELDEAMADRGWSVTFSIGAVTFRTPPRTEQELVRLSDEQMYRAKREGKNRVRHEVREITLQAG